MRRDLVRSILWGALSILVWSTAISCAGAAGPSPVTESQVRAAYLYNFAKFIEWPEQALSGPNAPILICVLNDVSFESTLREVVSSRSIDGHPVLVAFIPTAADAHPCHILFISSSHNEQARSVIAALRSSGIVTVGETRGFLEEGGIISFALVDGRVQFQVNLKAATQSGLHISARLLGIATRVIQ